MVPPRRRIVTLKADRYRCLSRKAELLYPPGFRRLDVSLLMDIQAVGMSAAITS
jgi:hypothetical protein